MIKKREIWQWLVLVMLSVAAWIMGEVNFHVHHFPYFVGVLFLFSMALVLVMLWTTTEEDLQPGETPDQDNGS